MGEDPTEAEGQDQPTADMEALADEPQPGLIREFFDFLRYNKKWWLAPIVIVLILLGVLVVLNGTGVLPFIYMGF